MDKDTDKSPAEKPAAKAKAKGAASVNTAKNKAARAKPVKAPEKAQEQVKQSAAPESPRRRLAIGSEKRPLNKSALAIMLALTALTGAVGGSFGTDILHSMRGGDAPSIDMSLLKDMEKQVSTMQAKLERLARDLGQVKSAANTNVQAATGQDQETLEKMLAELSQVQEKITQLEARPVALGASSGGETSDSAASDGPSSSSGGVIAGDVYTRLENSETSLKQMQAQLDKQSAQLEQVKDPAASSRDGSEENDLGAASVAETRAALAEMQTRLDQLEGQMNEFNLGAPDTKEQITAMQADLTRLSGEVDSLATAEPVPLPLFPKEAVLEALEKDEAERPRGWLGRTMSKHIVVRDEAALAVLDEIEQDLEQGNVNAALSAIDKLPPSAQSAAADWQAEVKALRHK